ncbi:MAG: hypothetical protein KAX31_04055 [Thermoplasmata archaeon]|nr:hypothetical protein [Thermoplasmata archaeon]
MDNKKFTVDDAADLFGDEVEEEIEPDQDLETELKMKYIISRAEKDPEPDDMIMDIAEKALEIVGKSESIYKLTLQGRLEIEFPLVDKRTVRKAVNTLKDHPEVKWPHDMLLQKI